MITREQAVAELHKTKDPAARARLKTRYFSVLYGTTPSVLFSVVNREKKQQ